MLPLLAVAIAAALRFWHLGQNSLWIDEFASLSTAIVPVRQIPAAALSHDAFEPPLYFWLLHGIMRVAGDTEWALRILSATAGTLTVAVFQRLARSVSHDARVGNSAALLLATNPLHLWYSQEARPYALVVLLGCSALLCLAQALNRGRLDGWIGFTVLSALTVLTHVTGGVFFIVGCLWAIRARGWPVVRQLGFAALGIFVLTLPFLVSLTAAVRGARGTGSPERPLTGLELPYTLYAFVAGYSFGPPVREIQDLGWQIAVRHDLLETAIGGALLVWLAVLLAVAALRARRQVVTDLGMLLILPLVTMMAGSLITTKSYNVRYALPALLGMLSMVALALERLPRRHRLAALGTTLAVFLWADGQWFTSPVYWKEDSRGAAACLAQQLPPGSTVAVGPPYMRDVLAHYSSIGAGLRYVAASDPEALEAAHPDALAITRPSHLLVTESQLTKAFVRQAGKTARTESVVGYRLHFAGGSGGPCRPDVAAGP